jgi:hypothetical protein
MAAMTDALAGALLAHALKQTPYPQPAGLWFSIHTASPTRAGLRDFEVALTGAGYARYDITVKMSVPTGSPPRSVNTGVITIGPATADWGTILAGGVDDDATAGTMRFFGLASEARTISIGESFQLVLSQFAARFQ